MQEFVAVLPFNQGQSELSLLDEHNGETVNRIISHFLSDSESLSNVRPYSAEITQHHEESRKVDTASTNDISMPTYFPRLGLIVGTLDNTRLNKLRSDGDVMEVIPAPDFRLIDSFDLLDSEPEQSWSIQALRIPEIWGRGITGKDVLVGHLDSGVFRDHPALANAIEALATVDSDGGFEESISSNDEHGHGTHTAGIICGRPNGTALVGIAPGAKLVAANVIQGDKPRLQLLAGLEWLLSRKVRVLALSVGIEPFNPVYTVVIDRLRAAGVLPIAAIGNSSVGTSYSPANYPNAIGVGSIRQDESVSVLSCSASLPGPPPYTKPDLVAPGDKILSTSRTGSYEQRSGTSQATPCVAGIAALLMEAKPDASIDEIEQAIFNSCRILGNTPQARQGRGLIDPIVALEFL